MSTKMIINNPDSVVIESVVQRNSDVIVMFRKNPTIYKFAGIPQETVDEWVAAESKGSYFAKNIRPKYTPTKA